MLNLWIFGNTSFTVFKKKLIFEEKKSFNITILIFSSLANFESACQMGNRENRLEIIIGAKSLAGNHNILEIYQDILWYLGNYWQQIIGDKIKIRSKCIWNISGYIVICWKYIGNSSWGENVLLVLLILFDC